MDKSVEIGHYEVNENSLSEQMKKSSLLTKRQQYLLNLVGKSSIKRFEDLAESPKFSDMDIRLIRSTRWNEHSDEIKQSTLQKILRIKSFCDRALAYRVKHPKDNDANRAKKRNRHHPNIVDATAHEKDWEVTSYTQ